MLIDSVMLVLILSNLLLLGFSQLRSCIRAIAVQGIALGALPLLAREDGVAVWVLFLCAITVSLKGIVFPRLLLNAIQEDGSCREVDPYVGYGLSILAGFASLAVSAWLCSRLSLFRGATHTLAAPVSFFMIFVGLFTIISRKKAISQVLGYLVLENGMYVFGVVMLREIPLLVELGVLLDAFAAVFVMGIAVYRINQEFDHTDVDQLDMLKG